MNSNQDCVVLLHGLGPGRIAMEKISHYLSSLGYEVCNVDYPAKKFPIEVLAKSLQKQIQKLCSDGTGKMHFVTFSMGGIVLRELLEHYRPVNLGRVVMIAPPNKGSEVADFLQRFNFYKRIFGPAGQQLGTNGKGIIHRLKKIDYEVGVIAGNRTVDPWFSWFVLPGPGDGKVTIENTKIEGMKDHIVIGASHPFITGKKETRLQAAYFLQHGTFKHEL